MSNDTQDTAMDLGVTPEGLALLAEKLAQDAQREAALAAQQAADNILRGVAPAPADAASKAAREANSAACEIDLSAGIMTVDLTSLKYLVGQSGKVSGHATLYIGTKQVGSVLFNAPADSMAKQDRAQSAEASKLASMANAAIRRGDHKAAENYVKMADDAQARFDAAKNAAKLDWNGKPVIEALHHIDAK